MPMEGVWDNTPSITDNNYLYNQNQYNNDFGLGLYDYGPRNYDPTLGRFNGMDIFAEANAQKKFLKKSHEKI